MSSVKVRKYENIYNIQVHAVASDAINHMKWTIGTCQYIG